MCYMLNKYLQKAIIKFYNDSTNQCNLANSDCDKCSCKSICWSALEIDYLKLQFFKMRE